MGWEAWEDLGGALTSDPAAVSWGPNRVNVFASGLDNALWTKSWDGVRWSEWYWMGGNLTSGPDVASRGPGRLDVFVRGPDNALFTRNFDVTSGWSDWYSLGRLPHLGPRGATASRISSVHSGTTMCSVRRPATSPTATRVRFSVMVAPSK